MNTDELKIIMDALVQLGEAGKYGFIWWLVIGYGLHYLSTIAIGVIVFLTVRLVITRLIVNTHGNQLGQELSNMLQTDRDGYCKWINVGYRAETKAAIVNKVREMLADQKKP